MERGLRRELCRVTAATLKIRGVRSGLIRQESRKGCIDTMGVERDIGREPRSDVICLEGNGYRPSHKGDGWIVGGAMYTLNSTEVHAVCYGIDLYNQTMTGGSKTLNSISSDCDHVPCVLVVENHPADSRVTIREDGICQALTSRMGTGGGNVPLVLTYDQNICRKEIL